MLSTITILNAFFLVSALPFPALYPIGQVVPNCTSNTDECARLVYGPWIEYLNHGVSSKSRVLVESTKAWRHVGDASKGWFYAIDLRADMTRTPFSGTHAELPLVGPWGIQCGAFKVLNIKRVSSAINPLNLRLVGVCEPRKEDGKMIIFSGMTDCTEFFPNAFERAQDRVRAWLTDTAKLHLEQPPEGSSERQSDFISSFSDTGIFVMKKYNQPAIEFDMNPKFKSYRICAHRSQGLHNVQLHVAQIIASL